MLTLADSFKNGVTSTPIRRIMEMASPSNLVKMGLNPDDVISFAGGWVNHQAPEEFRLEYANVIQDHNLFHRTGGYSPSDGRPELKKALINFNHQLYGISTLTEENIIIGQSSTQLTFSLFRVLLNPKDKIVMFDPTYANYPEQIKMSLGTQNIVIFPVFDAKKWTYMENEDERAAEFELFMGREKPKLILFSSPDNPTGMMLPDLFVKKMLDCALKHHCYVAIDFAYYTFLYKRKLPAYFFYTEKQYPNLVKIFSNSKWCRSLGRRLGWITASEPIIESLKVVQQCLILSPDTLHDITLTNYINKGLQDGSLKAYIQRINDDYESVSEFTCQCIKKYLSSRFTKPEGGLYSVVDVGMDGDTFVENILKQTGVIFVPGAGFGNSLKNGIRISFGPLVYDKKKIEEGFQRVSKVYEKIL